MLDSNWRSKVQINIKTLTGTGKFRLETQNVTSALFTIFVLMFPRQIPICNKKTGDLSTGENR